MLACRYGKLEAVRELTPFRPEQQRASSTSTDAKEETNTESAPELQASSELEGESVVELGAEAGAASRDGSNDEAEDDSEPDFENDMTIRAKWTMDGAETLDQAIEQLRGFADYLAQLKSDGWVLNGGIADDYGSLYPAPTVADVNLKNKVSAVHLAMLTILIDHTHSHLYIFIISFLYVRMVTRPC